MALNAKQKIFVAEYLVDKNATRAAKTAGYSKKTAHSQGPRLLENVEIAEAIEKGIARQVRHAELRALQEGFSKDDWLRELRLIAGVNMDDFVTIEKVEHKNGTHGRKFEITHANAAATKDRPSALGKAIKKISETKNGIGVELHSKQAALELLGRHYGWITAEMALNLPEGGVQVVLTMPSNGSEVVTPSKPETTNETDKNET